KLFEFASQQSNNLNDTNLETPNMNENNNLHSHEHWRPFSKLQRLYDRVPVCEACKKQSTRFQFLYLSPMPEKIVSVSLPIRNTYHPYIYIVLWEEPQIETPILNIGA
ncbi:39614_t:CDS:2, partial [Gigaspora margarita]